MSNSKYCLTKAEIADAIYQQVQLDKQKAIDIVELFIDIIKDALVSEGKAMFSGFGCWEVQSKDERLGRNPQTGEPMMLRARKTVKFKSSQILRKSINKGSLHLDEEERRNVTEENEFD